ncbi:MAG: GDSL-type esterase/lipase family protein [Clostridia bacterium]|nr:GDSL-type esterase/lipase family protein [Clostridia bacterium]
MEQVKQFGPGVLNCKSSSSVAEISSHDLELADATEEPRTILCYGDSNTYGFDPLSQKRHGVNVRWTMVLQKLLGDKYRVIEEGCNGRTAYNYVEECPWKTGDYGMAAILNSHKPIDLMVFMLGTNDLKNLYDATPQTIADAMLNMMNEAATLLLEQQEYVPEFLLISPVEVSDKLKATPFSDQFDQSSADKSRELADALKQAAANFNFEGKTCHFLNAADYAVPSKLDCIHMDPDQHQRLAKAICDKIHNEIEISGLF